MVVSKESVDYIVDAKDLRCPEPLMRLQQAIGQMQVNQSVWLEATDLTTVRDVTHYCHFLQHELLLQQQQGEVFQFVVVKRV